MKLGNKNIPILIFFLFFYIPSSFSEDKILSSPLINLNELKPSFEEVEELKENTNSDVIRIKKKNTIIENLSNAKFIGLDKITAKTSNILINLGETKIFGQLEIKVLKCGKIGTENKKDSVAYVQVKDISKNQNEKVFIFNGWTFSSDPTITPFDHAIYDLQLVSCDKV